MENRLLGDFIRRMPKVDLHVHLDGCVKPETIMELARSQDIPLPVDDKAGLIPYMQVGEECCSLKQYLSKFDFVLPFLQSGTALERVAYEAVEQSAAHNGRYVEVRFAPQLHVRNGLSVEEAIHCVIEGLKRAEGELGVKARAIAICLRSHSREANVEVVEAAAQFAGKGLAAVDLAGDEASYPPELFRDVFAISRRKGIPVTIHAGEAGGARNIGEAISSLGAVRIGHGVRLKESPPLLETIVKSGIPLEMCPSSNIQTKAVSGWDTYPIREYFDRGIAVTVNTDNPTVSGTTITREYEILAETFGFTTRELVRLVMNGVDAAFLEDHEKQSLKREFQRLLDESGVNA